MLLPLVFTIAETVVSPMHAASKGNLDVLRYLVSSMNRHKQPVGDPGTPAAQNNDQKWSLPSSESHLARELQKVEAGPVKRRTDDKGFPLQEYFLFRLRDNGVWQRHHRSERREGTGAKPVDARLGHNSQGPSKTDGSRLEAIAIML